MRINIKNENDTKIIREIYLNDNALLEFYQIPNFTETYVRVKYITQLDDKNILKDDYIYTFDLKGCHEERQNDNTILISADGRTRIEYNSKAVAVFTPIINEENRILLIRLYDLNEHKFINRENRDIHYLNSIRIKSDIPKLLRKEKKA